DDRIGGAGGVAVLAAALGAEAVLVGIVGDDESGRAVRHALRAAGCADTGVLTDAARPTTLKQRYVCGAGDHPAPQIFRADVEEHSPLSPALEDRLRATIADHAATCDIVLVSDYGKGVCT